MVKRCQHKKSGEGAGVGVINVGSRSSGAKKLSVRFFKQYATICRLRPTRDRSTSPPPTDFPEAINRFFGKCNATEFPSASPFAMASCQVVLAIGPKSPDVSYQSRLEEQDAVPKLAADRCQAKCRREKTLKIHVAKLSLSKTSKLRLSPDQKSLYSTFTSVLATRKPIEISTVSARSAILSAARISGGVE